MINLLNMSNILFIIAGVIGPWQIALIVLVVVLIFGGKKIPEMFKGIGEGIKEFKKATNTEEKESEPKSEK